MATEHMCSCLLFFGVKLVAGIWNISCWSRKNLMKSDVSFGMSILQTGPNLFCLWLEQSAFEEEAVWLFSGAVASVLKLLGCTMGRVTRPLVKSHNKKGWHSSSVSQRYQTRGCVCSQPHLSCGQHFAPEEISKSGCLNNTVEMMWYHPAGGRGQSLSYFFPLQVIPSLLVLAWASSEIIFLASLEKKQCRKMNFFHRLNKLDQHTIRPNEYGKHHKGQSSICSW